MSGLESQDHKACVDVIEIQEHGMSELGEGCAARVTTIRVSGRFLV